MVARPAPGLPAFKPEPPLKTDGVGWGVTFPPLFFLSLLPFLFSPPVLLSSLGSVQVSEYPPSSMRGLLKCHFSFRLQPAPLSSSSALQLSLQGWSGSWHFVAGLGLRGSGAKVKCRKAAALKEVLGIHLSPKPSVPVPSSASRSEQIFTVSENLFSKKASRIKVLERD